jgi:ATP-dependent HslUV protease ATP-binding subunit HslU
MPAIRELTPRSVVQQLDAYIVGQDEAKRAVAVALRNRWRRQQLEREMAAEVMPKNIIMIGPTGVGKTEIARRLAGLANAPFVKVEASNYTEVGYHGRDVESMVRELVELSMGMVRAEMTEEVRDQAEQNAEERLLDQLARSETMPQEGDTPEEPAASSRRARERLREMLHKGKLDDREVDVEVTDKPAVQTMTMGGMEMGFDMQGFLEEMIPTRSETRTMKVREARETLVRQECERLVDGEAVQRKALWRAQNMGIIFIDEIDKICGSHERSGGPDVSREGVQRDMLPIVEGCTVPTRHGIVHTDHILFIAAGAFNVSKPNDMIPELQGRFPIRVELDELTRNDLARILREPRNALTRQYSALLQTEDVELVFEDEAIDRLAEYAEEVNRRTQSIGARRLHTIMERLLEELSFAAPEMGGGRVVINRAYVEERLENLVEDEDLTRYIL